MSESRSETIYVMKVFLHGSSARLSVFYSENMVKTNITPYEKGKRSEISIKPWGTHCLGGSNYCLEFYEAALNFASI
jgi:hypothetical protein